MAQNILLGWLAGALSWRVVATAAALQLSTLLLAASLTGAQYRAVATNSQGSATSNAATPVNSAIQRMRFFESRGNNRIRPAPRNVR